jgi:hypothetical protein
MFPPGMVFERGYYAIHLYSLSLIDLWQAVFRLLRLDYNPVNIGSIGLEPGRPQVIIRHHIENDGDEEAVEVYAPSIMQWQMETRQMETWLASRKGNDYCIRLHCFKFAGDSTNEIIRASVNGTVLFLDEYDIFEGGEVHFSPRYVAMILLSNRLPANLLYGIIRANVEAIQYHRKGKRKMGQ